MHQDWDTIKWQKNSKKTKEIRESQLYNSRRTNAQANNVKLDYSTTPDKIDKIPKETSKKLMQGRISKKIKQSELASRLSLPVKTIQDIEAGRHKKNNQLFQKIARTLGIKL